MPDLVLNELSFQCWEDLGSVYACTDVYTARALMDELIQTVRATSRYKSIAKALRTEAGFMNYLLAEGYSIAKWLSDPQVDRDSRTYLRNRGSIGFYIDDTLAQVAEASDRTEVRVENRPGHGLCAAWLLNAICLSLASNEIWKTSSLNVRVGEIIDDGVFVEADRRLPHASIPEHFSDHVSWLTRTQRAKINSGSELLARSSTLFPSIEICGRAIKQISDLNGGEQYFDWLLDCLEVGDRLVANWLGGPFPHDQLPCKASGESATVWKSKDLIGQRYFKTLNGELLLFEFHMKANFHGIRIHYLPDFERKVLMIGYVGKHLPTALY
jgi:hypothetical protein